MSDAVNMITLVSELPKRRRGRACIVMTREYQGQREWAAKLAEKTGSAHVDLLESFSGNDDLQSSFGGFQVAELFDFLSEQREKPVLIVSGMEFLKASWSGLPNTAEEFAGRVETWEDTPALIFVMQYDKKIAGHSFNRFPQYSFIIDQRETIAI